MITFVIFASGLKYIGVAATQLGWILVATLVAGFTAWLAFEQPWRQTRAIAGAEADR